MVESIKIDAHQHFWQISREDYDWMTDDVENIRHDILPSDLSPLIDLHDITGTVVVQAAATVAETEFLIGLAEKTNFIKGLVGWVDLTDADTPQTLDRLMQSTAFKGVRPMLQDIEDTKWISQPKVMANLAALAERGLRLDALVQPRHLGVLVQVAKELPELAIVIDHCAKPVIADGADAGTAWRDGMARLAELPNVVCKISGLANESGPGWSAERLQPVIDHVLRQFGAERVMWGSDWPVLNLVGDYARWRAVSAQLLQGCSDQDRAEIYGGTAVKFYGLEFDE